MWARTGLETWFNMPALLQGYQDRKINEKLPEIRTPLSVWISMFICFGICMDMLEINE
jgi:hypothetical protein